MTLLIVAAALAAGGPQPSFDAFFAEFAQKRDAVRVLEAQFTQDNITPEETVASSGSIVYVKPRRILFRYEKPDSGVTYLVDNHKAYEYEPDVAQVQIFDLQAKEQTEIFFLGFDNNTEALRRDYDVSLFKVDEKGLASQGILIKPKKAVEGGKEDKANFEEVGLYLRDADFLPVRIHIVNDPESEVDIRVQDFKINGKLEAAKAQLNLPEKTKIFQNDELIKTVGADGEKIPALDEEQQKSLISSVSSAMFPTSSGCVRDVGNIAFLVDPK